MSLLIHCPHCKTPYQLPVYDPGQRLLCQKCQQVFMVAPIGPAAPPVRPTAPPVPPVRSAPHPIPPVRSTAPPVEPTAVRAAPRPAPPVAAAKRPEVPVARAVKEGTPRATPKNPEGRPARSSYLPLLVGCGVLAALMLFLTGAGALAIWYFWDSSSPNSTGAIARSDSGSSISNTSGNSVAGLASQTASTLSVPAAVPLKPAHAARGLEDLKAATVFIKVTAGPLRGSGSGFLIQTDGTTGYLVTNEHVVTPPQEETAPGRVRALPTPELNVVFRSGTKREQNYRAEVLAKDAENDLAILKVTGASDLPNPIDVTQAPKLMETLPVTVYGYPFGERLSVEKGNPAITVSQGTVSSIRRDANDQIVAVQIDGAINPGNSGGPVLDTEGRLVGIAAATIRGAHIGIAIPSTELNRLLEGRVGTLGFRVKEGNNDSSATAEVEAVVLLLDPLHRLGEIAVYYLPADQLKEEPKADAAGMWAKLPGAQRAVLQVDGMRANGTFRVSLPTGEQAYRIQASYVVAGKEVFTEPKLFGVRPNPGPGRNGLTPPSRPFPRRPQPPTSGRMPSPP